MPCTFLRARQLLINSAHLRQCVLLKDQDVLIARPLDDKMFDKQMEDETRYGGSPCFETCAHDGRVTAAGKIGGVCGGGVSAEGVLGGCEGWA